MSCPAESSTLDEFDSGSATYSNRQSSGIRKRLKDIGIKIYEAISLGKVPKDDAYKAKMELEKILGTNITGSAYVDGAWSCECDSKPLCTCNPDRTCSCEEHKKCNHCWCDDHCACDRNCKCDNDDPCSCHGECFCAQY